MKALIQILGLGLLTGSRTWAASAILNRHLADNGAADLRGLTPNAKPAPDGDSHTS